MYQVRPSLSRLTTAAVDEQRSVCSSGPSYACYSPQMCLLDGSWLTVHERYTDAAAANRLHLLGVQGPARFQLPLHTDEPGPALIERV